MRKEKNFLRVEIPNPDEETFFAFQEAFRVLCRDMTRQQRDDTAPSEYLGTRGQITQRQANNILGRKQGVTLKVLWRLLRSEQLGPRFHAVILGNLKTEWSRTKLDDQQLADAKRRVEEAQRVLKDLEGRAQ